MEFKLDEAFGFILNKTNSKIKNGLFRAFGEFDVTPEQWAILKTLWEEEGITPKELADRTFKDKPTTNRMLKRLQAKGLIVRRAHPEDRRSYQVFLTEQGWLLKDELIPRAKQYFEKATRGIEAEQINEMKKLLNQIYDNLQ